MTTQAKLSRLIDTKTEIRQTLIRLGVEVPIETPFNDYPSLMEQLVNMEFEETTTDQDLLQMIDLYYWLGKAEYDDYEYTEKEIQAVHNLLDIINNGEPEKIVDNSPALVITSFGETHYYIGEKFSLDGYKVYAVYPDGNKIDVTSQCLVIPNEELSADDKVVTITCIVDDIQLSVMQNITTEIPPTQVEYIQSDGSQYIDTKMYMTNSTRVEMDFAMTSKVQESMLIGTWDNDTNGFLFGLCGANNGAFKFAYCNNAWNGNYVGYDTEKHKLEVDSTSARLDGTALATKGNKNLISTSTIRLFNHGTQSGSFSKACAKVYGFKLYDGDDIIMNLIPVKNPSGIYCMYDTVKEEYYYSASSKNFTGSDAEEVQLEYIQSSGTQYIDTGIVPKNTTRMILELKYNASLDASQTHGWGSSSSAEAFFVGIDGTDKSFSSAVSSSYKLVTSGIPGDKDKHTFDVKSGSQKLDDVEYGTDNTLGNTATSGQTLYLCALHAEWDTNPLTYCKCNIYSCKIYDGDTLVRNFVPYRDLYGICGLKDLIENKYYYNKGSGIFISGPVKN